jgi:apolipoprotein D and lipocalin family protein
VHPNGSGLRKDSGNHPEGGSAAIFRTEEGLVVTAIWVRLLAGLRGKTNPGSRVGTLPVPRVDGVNLDRYMGHWYVLASIPTPPERGATNAVECYARAPNGSIHTRFRYRPQGSLRVKTVSATGFVEPGSGQAVWGVRFVWPFKAQYVISWIDADYQRVIVARDARDHVWIMARTPSVDERTYDVMVSRAAAMGYDLAKIVRLPQHWPEPQAAE